MDASDIWRGEFGNAYTERNAADDAIIRACTGMWARMLRPLEGDPPSSILEVGSNLGINLRVLRRLTDAGLIAVEPNATARARLVEDGVVEAENIHDAIAASLPLADASVDLAFTSGVLIHIHPRDLLASCTEIHRVAAKYILCIEYFSPYPEEVRYRDREGLLFKRDFGDFWMSNFTDLRLRDYGFFWRRATGVDDLNWWLFEKSR